jgi:hypothetical protein
MVPTDFIVSMSIELPKASAASLFGGTFKVMGRHANSHALVNAGFKLALSSGVINDAYLVVGNIKAAGGPLLCTKTAAALKSLPLSSGLAGVFAKTLPVFKAELTAAMSTSAAGAASSVGTAGLQGPSNNGNGSFIEVGAEYRLATATGLYYKFLLAAIVANGGSGSPVDKRLLSAATTFERAISGGTQTFPTTGAARAAEAPVGQAVHKMEGPAQAAGLIHYTSDQTLASAVALFGAPVLSTKSKAMIASIDASVALATAGVTSFVSAADIAKLGGKNNVSTVFGSGEVFATTPPAYGVMVGMVVATSEGVARRAARLGVTIHYSGSTRY